MELAFLLRGVGAEVVWLTIQKPTDSDEVIYSLEHRMLDRGVKVVNHYYILHFVEMRLFAITLMLCAIWY